MEIFNVGVPELIIIFILMFLLLGPKEMIRTAQRIGAWVRKAIKSPMWREVMGYSQEIRELPQKIMDESGLKETLEEVRKDTTAATNEINASLKEVAEAARVKEAEHVRIEFDPKDTNTIAPPALNSATTKTELIEAPPAEDSAPLTAEAGDVETADAEAATAESAAASTADTPASTPAAGSEVSAAIAAAAAAAEAKAEEKAKQRPANRPQPGAHVVGIPVIQPAVVKVAAPQEAAAPQEVAPQDVAAPHQDAAQEVSMQESPAAEPVKTRKPRRKKAEEAAPAVVEVTLEESPPLPVAPQQEAAAPKVEETPRKTRGRKAKQDETVSLTGAQGYPESGTANGNGNGKGASAESSAEAVPVKRARKPRVARQNPSNGSGPTADIETNPTTEEQSQSDAA